MYGRPHHTNNLFFSFDFHDGIFTPPWPPIGLIGLHFSCGILGGGPTGSHKTNKSVFANGIPIVSQGHEVALWGNSPHINIYPITSIDILIPLLILTSSNKCHLAASNVISEEGPVAVSIAPFLGINTSCGDPIDAPTSFVYTPGTVQIGYTFGDIFAMLTSLAYDIIISLIASYIFDKAFEGLKGVNNQFAKYFDKEIDKMDYRIWFSQRRLNSGVLDGKWTRTYTFLWLRSGSKKSGMNIGLKATNSIGNVMKNEFVDTVSDKIGSEATEGLVEKVLSCNDETKTEDYVATAHSVDKLIETGINMSESIVDYFQNNSESLDSTYKLRIIEEML